MPSQPHSQVPPLVVGSAGARLALGVGKTRFLQMTKAEDFPPPLPGSAPNKPQWAWIDLVRFVERRRLSAGPHVERGDEPEARRPTLSKNGKPIGRPTKAAVALREASVLG